MSRTILLVAYPLAPVGPDTAGGAEQVVAALAGGLTAAGHHAITVAQAGSVVAGTLVGTPRRTEPLDGPVQAQAQAAHRAAITEALARWPIDLVHLHGIDFAAYLPPPGPPVLVTLHLPLGWYAPGDLRPSRPRTWLHAVSAAQRRAGPVDLDLLPDIENGVPLARLGGPHARRGFVLALGRICEEKGFHLALDAARAAGLPLLLGGEVFGYLEHRRYFEREIAPRLDRWRRFLGPLGFARKHRLLAAARCLVVPSTVAETGSLVALEALASGTPVVAFAQGVLPELIEDGRTGFVVTDVPAMAAAMRRCGGLDAAACRASVAHRDLAGTVRRYLSTYEHLLVRPAVDVLDAGARR